MILMPRLGVDVGGEHLGHVESTKLTLSPSSPPSLPTLCLSCTMSTTPKPLGPRPTPFPISSTTLPILSLVFLLPIWIPGTSKYTIYALGAIMIVLVGPASKFAKNREEAIVNWEKETRKREDDEFLSSLSK